MDQPKDYLFAQSIDAESVNTQSDMTDDYKSVKSEVICSKDSDHALNLTVEVKFIIVVILVIIITDRQIMSVITEITKNIISTESMTEVAIHTISVQ